MKLILPVCCLFWASCSTLVAQDLKQSRFETFGKYEQGECGVLHIQQTIPFSSKSSSELYEATRDWVIQKFWNTSSIYRWGFQGGAGRMALLLEKKNPFLIDSINKVVVVDYIMCNRCLADRGMVDMTFKLIVEFKDEKLRLTVLDWLLVDTGVLVSKLITKNCQLRVDKEHKTVKSLESHFADLCVALNEHIEVYRTKVGTEDENNTDDW